MSQPNTLDPAKILDGMLEMDGRIAPYYTYFHDYSATNLGYLWAQGVREIPGKRSDWAKIGREVKPGSERYKIWVPWFRKIHDPADPAAEPVEVLGGFNDVPCLYTYSQTTGEPVKPKPIPQFDLMQMAGRLSMRVIPFTNQSGNLQGYSRGNELAVSPIAADPRKTFIHEAGHILLGHTLGHSYEEFHASRGVMEFQAEAVA